MHAAVIGIVVAVVGVLMSLACFYPIPPLSPQLKAWRDKGKTLNYQGHNIFYIDVAGSGDHGTVICLHGFPTFSWDWNKMLPGLQGQFSRIIMLDFLGFGLSDKPTSHSYSIFEQADIVTHLARQLSVTESHLLAHDYGDTVALELLSRHNQARAGKTDNQQALQSLALHSLTMLNGGIFPQTHKPRIIQKLLLVPMIGPVLARLTFFALFKRSFGEVFGDNKPSEEEFADFYAGYCHLRGHHNSASLLQYIPERHANEQRWVGALKNSHVPVLMIYGPANPVNPPQFADLFRKEAPNHQLVVLDHNIGHYPQWEDTRSTVVHMTQFLKTHKASQVPDSHS